MAEATRGLHELTATELRAAIEQGECRAVDAVEASLARIEACNADLNAFCFVYADDARADARRLDRNRRPNAELPPLFGIPYALKDFTPTRGRRTTRGSMMFADWLPDEDAPIVERLRDAGGVLVGKTTTSELAHSSFTRTPLWGVTRNPWNPDRTPGGSSGGSAAAVAARMVPLAEGSDAGGSIRIPASCCGVVGFKPSLGRVPMHAFASDFESIFHFGPIARTVADVRLMFGVMQGPDDRDPLSVIPALGAPALSHSVDVAALRVAVSADLGYYDVDPAIAQNTMDAAAVFRALGATVTDVALGWDRSANDAWTLNWSVLLATLYGDLEATHRTDIDPELSKLIAQGRRSTAIELKTVDLVRTRLWARLRDVFRSHDVLLCPTVALSVPAAVGVEDSDYESDTATGAFCGFEMTSPFSLVPQCPVISVPSGTSPDGLPTGIQLVGNRFADADLLAVAAAYEQASPWPTVRL